MDVIPSSQELSETTDDCFDDDFDMSQIEIPDEPTVVPKKPVLEKFEEEMLKDWVVDTDSNTGETSIDLECSDIPLTSVDNKKVFRFFWWDAFEDTSNQPGVVFLFGKTYHEKPNSFISCCVAVRNIERRIFFLPRIAEEDSDQLVMHKDVYAEVNAYMTKNMHVMSFKTRTVSKRYAFDPQIPAECDYIEVRYSVKYPPVPRTAQGKTFSRVLGTESSSLEILLLDRKIKGPCWLDVANPSSVANPVSWCRLEVDCNGIADISKVQEVIGRPPLIVSSINMRYTINPRTGSDQIVMLSCVTNACYSVDKQAPTEEFFQKHFCVFTNPEHLNFPVDMYFKMKNYETPVLQKMNSEKALLNYFISKFASLDCDLLVGHDLQGHQIDLLAERLSHHQCANFGKLSRIKRPFVLRQKLGRDLFIGRLVCDIEVSAKESMRCRSYDLDGLCQTVLKLPEGQRINLESEMVSKIFETSSDILKLIALSLQDTAYILRIMYSLNIIHLALEITNVAGNVMSKTLMGGRSERNESLLLHAFSEKGYIAPDKSYSLTKRSANKKPTFSGGLVLNPKVGFYDRLILLMDFNSLYPSIIQEYNICFTTVSPDLSDDNMSLSDGNLPPGILPTEITKLVRIRRAIKKLMNNPDLSPDQKMQFHMREMALKLTANTVYGCLGFPNSRFFAKNLAALITHKGREILTNAKDTVQRMNYEVIYGDTDSLMINTNTLDFDRALHIANEIKQEVNKLYKQVELDMDGVFKYLLLFKKKKYAAVTLVKTESGELKTETEYKGLEIIRRDWSQLAAETGKLILGEILRDQSSADRVSNVLTHLRQLKEDLESGKIPPSQFVILKQLTKNPRLYSDASFLPHVQVALRCNKESGGHFRAGDTVPYVICDDGTEKPASRRAYHIEELRKSRELKVDINYYLEQQIRPVISRICAPIGELDVLRIGECLGIDSANPKKPKRDDENVKKCVAKFRNCEPFIFKCHSCRTENTVDAPASSSYLVLAKCANPECTVRPVDYMGYILNQMVRRINVYIEKYYEYEMCCENPMCTYETRVLPLQFSGRNPMCSCQNSVMLKKYTEDDLYLQISYFHYLFDWDKMLKKPIVDYQIEIAYEKVKETVKTRLSSCRYSFVDVASLVSIFHKSAATTEQELRDLIKSDFPLEEDSEDLE